MKTAAQQLKDQQAKPSMRPESTTREEEETARPSIRELGIPLGLRTKLIKKITESDKLRRAASALEKQREAINRDVKFLLQEAGFEEKVAFDVDGIPVTRYTSTRSSVDKDLLLESGVLPSVIAACTKTTTIDNLRIGSLPKKGEV